MCFPANATIFLASKSSAPVLVIIEKSNVIPTRVVNNDTLIELIKSLSLKPKILIAITLTVIASIPILFFLKKAIIIILTNINKEIISIYKTSLSIKRMKKFVKIY